MGHVLRFPYGKSFLELDTTAYGDVQLIEPKDIQAEEEERAIVRRALEHPIGSKSLKELTKDVKKILIITNDNTRPMPSKITLPEIIDSFYYDKRYYDITILIATGLHRKMTEEEKRMQYGDEICDTYPVINHVAIDEEQLVSLGVMSTGNELWVNRLVAESDLVISEGFIEAHFFAGFSGGRKSILPGISGAKTIMGNHKPENIASPEATGANLCGNPIHLECTEAAKKAKLAFILNVALNQDKKIIEAFAGDPVEAHKVGCEFVKKTMSVEVKSTDIVITTNNGYPLDRNLYQVVKGIDTASKVVKEGGVIIVAAQCMDGVGHKKFEDLILSCSSTEELYEKMSVAPSMIDKWQVQVLAKAMKKQTVILVSEGISKELTERMFFVYAKSLEEAMEKALELKGKDATISIMPEGPVMIPVVREMV